MEAKNNGIVLIGIAGAGKTTLGKKIAEKLGLVHIDTDSLIEAYYGNSLQNIVDDHGAENFLAIENAVLAQVDMKNVVISTGGSAVYCVDAMKRMHELGTVIHLDIPCDEFIKRVSATPDRGIVVKAGFSLADVWQERQALYEKERKFVINTMSLSVEESLNEVLNYLKKIKSTLI